MCSSDLQGSHAEEQVRAADEAARDATAQREAGLAERVRVAEDAEGDISPRQREMSRTEAEQRAEHTRLEQVQESLATRQQALQVKEDRCNSPSLVP